MDEKTNAASAPLGAMLSNPALLRTLGSLLGSSAAKKEGGDASTDLSSLTEGIGNVLSNPALMSQLPAVMNLLRTASDNATPTVTSPEKKEEIDQGSANAPMIEEHAPLPVGNAPSPREKPRREQYRNDLLCALKPFLSRERCEAVDMILRLSALGNVLKQLQ